MLLFFLFCSIFFWRIDEVGGKERSGLPPNSSILIILSWPSARTLEEGQRVIFFLPELVIVVNLSIAYACWFGLSDQRVSLDTG